MGTHTQEEIADFPNLNQTRLNLQNFIHAKCAEPVKNFIQTVFDCNQDEELLKEMAYILHMVTRDATISSVVPFPSHSVTPMACIFLRSHRFLDHQILQNIKNFNKNKYISYCIWCK